MKSNKTIIGCSIGECVHVAGVNNFLNIAKQLGYKTIFLGPAVNISELVESISDYSPDIVGVSYRLSPETSESLLQELKESLAKSNMTCKFLLFFGGTPPVAEIAKKMEMFDEIFMGDSGVEKSVAVLKGEKWSPKCQLSFKGLSLVDRMQQKKPLPILRMHFGLPSMDATMKGIKKIAESGVLDILSLGTDQDCQENFFHPERLEKRREGAGGVPVRTPDDFKKLYRAAQTGNYPLMRTYAGTSDLIRQAEVHVATIDNCFAAIPIFWFNQLDGRGPMSVEESLAVHQETIKWYGEKNRPVEIIEQHHWSLRDAPDEVFVATAYIGAYNAKKFGVHDYILQLMFNTPPSLSFKMDLAKMLAAIEMVKSLEEQNFRVIVETRSGLPSFPLDPDFAKGHLASSTMLQLAVKPEIIHVLSFSEADHAANAEDVIESCKIVRKVVENCMRGLPDMKSDAIVQIKKTELIQEANLLIDAIKALSGSQEIDPLIDPSNLALALKLGILDAPHLKSSKYAKGQIETAIIDGACHSIHPKNRKPLSTQQRLEMINVIMGNSDKNIEPIGAMKSKVMV